MSKTLRAAVAVVLAAWVFVWGHYQGYQRALRERAWPTSLGGACYIFDAEPDPNWSPKPIAPPLEYSQNSWREM